MFRAGVYTDLSMNDGGALVAASDSAYDLSGLAVDVKYARCNIPPHTIVRAPGFLQGVMVLEQVTTAYWTVYAYIYKLPISYSILSSSSLLRLCDYDDCSYMPDLEANGVHRRCDCCRHSAPSCRLQVA